MPDPGDAPALYQARPTFTIDGRDEPSLSDGLIAMQVEETAAGLLHCEATFANWGGGGGVGYLHFDRTVLDFGKQMKISLGAGAAGGVVFDGRITGIEGRYTRQRPPEVLVLAEDRLADLRMKPRTRTFTQVTDAQVCQTMAQEHGLTANATVSGAQHKVLAQINQSDLAFLRDRARAVDAELWVDGTTLNMHPRAQRSAGQVTLTFGQGLLEFAVLADLAEQVSGFTVSGWDAAAKQPLQHRAVEQSLGSELGSDQGGSAVLASAMQTQRDLQVVHRLPVDALEAQALAESYFRRRARRFVVGHGLTQCDARLRVGARVTLGGLGTLFDGQYYVSRVRHFFDTARELGCMTQFTAERPGIGR